MEESTAPSDNQPKLTDQIVIAMRKEAHEDRSKGPLYQSKKRGFATTTIGHALRGNTFKHLNAIAPPVTFPSRKLNDKQVIHLRRTAHENNGLDFEFWAKKYAVSTSNIIKVVQGRSAIHLNATHPPFAKVMRKDEARAKARQMYQEGKSYNQIAPELGVSKSSVSLWCRDLVGEHRKKSAPAKSSTQVLSDDQVISMRQEVRASGVLNLALYARRYGVDRSSIANAIRGATFHHLNDQEPPVIQRLLAKVKAPVIRVPKIRTRGPIRVLLDDDVRYIRRNMRETQRKNLSFYAEKFRVTISAISCAAKGKTFKHLNEEVPPVTETFITSQGSFLRPTASEEIVQEAIRLRREDPKIWTRKALAAWINEKENTNYLATHVAQLMRKLDPTIGEVQDVKPPKPPRPPRVSKPRVRKPKERPYLTHECVVCERTFKSQTVNDEVCWREECKAIIAEHDHELAT